MNVNLQKIWDLSQSPLLPRGVDIFVNSSGHVQMTDVYVNIDEKYLKGSTHNTVFQLYIANNSKNYASKMENALNEIQGIIYKVGQKTEKAA